MLFNPALLIFAIFTVIGAFLLWLGIFIIARMYGRHSVEVEAECIEVEVATVRMGSVGDRSYMPNTKRPVYRYYYEGQQYTSAPLLRSNRPGYRPEPGPCTIRINPAKPHKVYSPERKFAGGILIAIGAVYLILPAVVFFLLRTKGVI